LGEQSYLVILSIDRSLTSLESLIERHSICPLEIIVLLVLEIIVLLADVFFDLRGV